ncbi:TetR/AcrR family transcriptional regulator [Salinibius halmophilus]|uniref:TetR/AcrR family transcriptional regulator n=1 Tax=Salinibius halmophilus TaxID=1853216 RepID=UPI001314908A|nr:TetR/AcrR family transcriptional regulator [Salinibius halmophilus]
MNGHERRSLQTRTKLLDTAVELLIEYGYAGVTSPMLCERAGMTRGALHHHFPEGKQALYTELLKQILTNMELSELPEEPVSRLRELLFALQKEQREYHFIFLELVLACRSDTKLQKLAWPTVDEGLNHILGKARGNQNEEVLMLLMMLQGAALQVLSNYRNDDAISNALNLFLEATQKS